MTRIATSVMMAAAFLFVLGTSSRAAQTPPVPKPFPQPGQPTSPPPTTPPRSGQPAAPAPPTSSAQIPSTVAAPAAAPTEATLGVPIYPGSEFLEWLDAGKSQRYYLFGTNATYAEVIAFYKAALKTDGRKLFDAPAMHQFDLPGMRFQEQTMAYPPSVVVKDYTWNSEGYLHADGGKEKRFRTIVQIVPAPGRTTDN